MDAVINKFYEYLINTRNLSDSTALSYKSDISHFKEYIKKPLRRVKEEDVRLYSESLAKRGNSSSTVLRNMVSLRALYSFMEKQSLIRQNPMEAISVPKVDKKLPQILTTEETERLLDAPVTKDAKGIRDKAMLELLYATGIKVSELIALNVSNVNLRRRMLVCQGGRGARVIPLGKQAVMSVSLYLKNARTSMLLSGEESALFVNCNGKRMSRQGFWKIIKGYQAASGIEKDITPHMLRHSFAAHLLQNGADLESIGEMMGLTDTASTAVYKKILENKIFDVYNKSHPRA